MDLLILVIAILSVAHWNERTARFLLGAIAVFLAVVRVWVK